MNKILTILFAFIGFASLAQPSNDLICGAISITPGDGCIEGTTVSATSTGSPATPSCFEATINDVWYVFECTDTRTVISLDVVGMSMTDTELAIYTTNDDLCTGTLTYINCNDNSGVAEPNAAYFDATGWTVGETYWIRIDGVGTGTFCLSVDETFVPGSYPCEAQEVFDNSAACSSAAGNNGYNYTGNWTHTVGTNYCGCDDETNQKGTWYHFTASSTSTTITNATAGGNADDLDVTLFTGPCNSLTCSGCQVSESGSMGAPAVFATAVGTEYWLLVTEEAGQTSNQRTDICVQGSAACTAPANDDCANAVAISANTTYSTNTYCATPDEDLCAGSTENNVWYTWTVPLTWTGNAYFNMWDQNCTGGDISYGQQASVYNSTLDCSNIPAAAVTTDCVTYSNQVSDVDVSTYWTPTAGATYYIAFDGYGGEVCQTNFSITNSASVVVILPIELLDFNVEKDNTNVLVTWATLSERNNEYFSIERSADGFNFHSIGKVKGAGNSDRRIDYEFYDNQPLKGMNYYRLRQFDFDGKSSQSIIKAVDFSRYSETVVNIYPNPTSNYLMVEVVGDGYQKGDCYNIYDITGKLVKSDSFNGVYVETYNLDNGTYFFELKSNDETYISRFVKN